MSQFYSLMNLSYELYHLSKTFIKLKHLYFLSAVIAFFLFGILIIHE